MAENYVETYKNFKDESLKDKNTLVDEIRVLFQYLYGKDEFDKFNQKYFNMEPLIKVEDLIKQSSAKDADILESKFGSQDIYVYQDKDGNINRLSDTYLNLMELAFIKYEQNSAQDSFSYLEVNEILKYREQRETCNNDNIDELYTFIKMHPNDTFKLRSADTGKPVTNLRLAQVQVDKLDIELA